MFPFHHLCIKRPLGLIEDKYMLRWDEGALSQVSLDVLLYAAHEGLAITTPSSKFVLKHFDQRAVATEEDRGSRGLHPRSCDCEIVEVVSVDSLQTDQCLA